MHLLHHDKEYSILDYQVVTDHNGEGNVFTDVCLFTVGLMATGSLIVLVTEQSVVQVIFFNTCLYSHILFQKPRTIFQSEEAIIFVKKSIVTSKVLP